MIENINEITEYLNTNKDNEEVVGLIKSFQQPLTRDVVETWCQDGDGRSWLDRNCDIYSNKAVKTAQENAIAKYEKETLPTKIEEAIKAKSTEGLTPEQIKLRELEKQLADMQAEKTKAELLNVNTSKLKEKGLDIGLAKYIKEDADIEFFSNLINNSVQDGVKAKLGDSNYTPPKTNGNPLGKISWEDVTNGTASYADYKAQENKSI
nr:MAG TPA: Major head protein [Caudoviricetes sp.]